MVTRSSISTKVSSTGWHGGARLTNGKRRRRYRHGCWPIVAGAGFGAASSPRTLWNGRAARVKSVKTGFKHAVKLAGLWGKVTPHTLQHTAATWLMQRGVPIWQAAGYLGMSAEMVDVY